MNSLELLKQRRVWAGIVGSLAFVLPLFGIEFSVDPAGLIDLLLNFGVLLTKAIEAVGTLVAAILAVWSYTHPKY